MALVWVLVVRVTMCLLGSSAAAETVRPPLSAKLPAVAVTSATGLLKVIVTWVRSASPWARVIPGGKLSPSVPTTAWIAGSQASAMWS